MAAKTTGTEVEQLKALIAEAHGVIRDLRTELKKSDGFFKEIVSEVIAEHVASGLVEYDEGVRTAMREAVAHVDKTFTDLMNRYLGQGDEGATKRLSLEELLAIRDAINQIEEEAQRMRRENGAVEFDVPPTPVPGHPVVGITLPNLMRKQFPTGGQL